MAINAEGVKRGFWRSGWPFALLIAATMRISCTGCLVLAIAPLGYEYEKDRLYPRRTFIWLVVIGKPEQQEQ